MQPYQEFGSLAQVLEWLRRPGRRDANDAPRRAGTDIDQTMPQRMAETVLGQVTDQTPASTNEHTGFHR